MPITTCFTTRSEHSSDLVIFPRDDVMNHLGRLLDHDKIKFQLLELREIGVLGQQL